MNMCRVEDMHSSKSIVGQYEGAVFRSVLQHRRQIFGTALEDNCLAFSDSEKIRLTADPVVICTGAFGFVYGWLVLPLYTLLS